jgi:methylglutaconyl-CoA hydratase
VPDLDLEQRGHTLVATAGRDVFTSAMVRELTEAVDRAETTDALRFVRIRTRGDVFCVGRERAGTTAQQLRREAAEIVGLNEALRTSPLTIVAEVNGDAAGFGAGIVAASDIAVAALEARLWFPEILTGLAPTVVISWLARAIPYKTAFDMVATGKAIAAEEAVRLGLVTEAVPCEELEPAVDAQIDKLADTDAVALREIKQFFAETRTMSPAAAATASIDALTISALRLVDARG